jgi:hypothetical protein
MAYHNMNEKNIPLTSFPDVPIASPIQTPVYAQPVAQPVTGQQAPYAQPAQPAYSAPQAYQPAYGQPMTYAQAPLPPQQVYSSNYTPPYQPAYAPSSIAQPSTPMTYEELKTALRERHSHFSCSRYIKDAHRFTKKNWCALLGALLMWSLIGWGVNAGIDAIVGKNHHHHSKDHPADCEQTRARDELDCGGMGCFRTRCEDDGSFAPKQTLGSSCWCVDEQGTKFEDTVQHCSLFTYDCVARRSQTACEAKRAQDTAACGNRLGCFITQCEEDGSFSPKQTHGSIGGCWCVDDKGAEINGTRATCGSETFCASPSWMPDMAASPDVGAVKRLALWGLLQLLATVLLWSPVLAGFFVAVFNAIKSNSRVRFRDFFSCFCCRYYCKLLRLSIVLRILEGILFLLFVLPGVWWSLVTVFAIPLHKEHSFLGVCGSIRLSMMVIHRHFCSMFGFLLLLTLIQFLGFLCFIVGLLYTMPLGFAALCFCYHDLIGVVPVVPVAGPVDAPVTVHV